DSVWAKAALYLDGISPALANLSILHSETNGLELYNSSSAISNGQFSTCTMSALRASSSSRPAITGTTFSTNGGSGAYTLSIDANSVPTFSSVTISGNTNQGIEIRGGRLATSALWKNLGVTVPYVVTGHTTVDAGQTLTIDPGTTVKFGSLVGLYVNGILSANSTSGRISFTSLKDDTVGGDTNNDGGGSAPGRGNWLGIYLAPTAGSSVLNNCDINYSGSDNYSQGLALQPHNSVWARTALYLDGISPQISGCQFLNSETNGIELWSSHATITGNTFQNMGDSGYPLVFDTTDTFPVMSGNSTSGSGNNGIALAGGEIGVSGTWNRPGANFPYYINNSMSVKAGTSLIIDPGNSFKVGWLKSFYIYGSLNAAGTNPLPILFTSFNSTRWLGIYAAPTASIPAFSYVTLDYAGADNYGQGLGVQPHDSVWAKAALYLDGISPALTNLSILHSETNGLELYGSSPAVTGSRFESCAATELVALAGSRPTVNGSKFIGGAINSGFTVDVTPTPSINARNNYWGAVSGPNDPLNNPAGTGVFVSNGIDYGSFRINTDVLFSIVFTGTGGGTVTSSPGDATCSSSTAFSKSEGTAYTLYATGDKDSLFGGWSSACSGSGSCNITLSTDTSLTATFLFVKPARIQGATPQPFDTLSAAYQAAGNGSYIQLRDYVFSESGVVFNRIVGVTVVGGYDKTFTAHSGVSVIKSLTIGLGSVVVENIVIK
ncbi:MAG: right-handed parallel beta-helix repeat-containing protein, partial [Desulfuromonadales bacterium]|nr:right-handed parallel beta-helix repeat-containing protein [Desulfuromonadales bacterium]